MVRLFITISLLFAMVGCARTNGHDDTSTRSVTGPGDRPRLQRVEPLPEIVRDLLRTNMLEHGDSMEALLWSALMLDHQTTEIVARRFLAQPRISRPAQTGEETANAWLPPRFYELQDRMYQAATDLHRAATATDDLGTARAYGVLAETCVTCHSLYLVLPADANREEDHEDD